MSTPQRAEVTGHVPDCSDGIKHTKQELHKIRMAMTPEARVDLTPDGTARVNLTPDVTADAMVRRGGLHDTGQWRLGGQPAPPPRRQRRSRHGDGGTPAGGPLPCLPAPTPVLWPASPAPCDVSTPVIADAFLSCKQFECALSCQNIYFCK